jgi:hypothetical protein
MDERHFGGCACGAVRYAVDGKPAVVQVCHCTFCQRRLSTAFAVIAAFPESVISVLQGRLIERVYRSDESGRWLRMSFCPDCGTTVSHISEIRPGYRSIAAGTFDDPDWFTIDRHIWVRSKRPWVIIPPGVATYDKGYVPSPPPIATNSP